MKKRTLSIALACAMVVTSYAGCAGAPKDETKTSFVRSAESKQPEATKTIDGKITLKWSVWDINLSPYYQPLINSFEKAHPNVKIEMVDLGSSDYQTVLATELTGSGSDFDVVTVKDVPGYITLVNKGVLEPLDSYIQSSGVDLNLHKGLKDQITIDKKLYELPFRNDFWVVFYNKDIFDKAGISYPTNNMTFEQYDELARSLAFDTPGHEVYGSHYHTWRSAIQLFGVLDGKHTILDGEYEFLKPYYEMVLKEQEDGVIQDYAGLKTSGLHYSGAFAQGNVAMMNMGTWFISTLMDKIRSGEYTDCTNWGIAKYPHAEGVEPGSTIATITSLAIPVNAPHKDLAWEFINFVSGKEGAKILASTGTIPAVMNSTASDLISRTDGFPKEDKTSVDALNTTKLYLEMPVNEKNSEIETVLNETHDAIMTGSISIDSGIAQMNEKISAILDK